MGRVRIPQPIPIGTPPARDVGFLPPPGSWTNRCGFLPAGLASDGLRHLGAPGCSEAKDRRRGAFRSLGRRLCYPLVLAASGIVLLASVSHLWAADPGETVRRSAKAAANVTYDGTWVVTEQGAGGVSKEARYREIWDGPTGRSRMDYTSPSSLAGTVVLDDGEWRTQYDPKTGEAMGQRSSRGALLPRVESQRLSLLVANYTCRDGGTGTMAGRACTIVEIVPRTPGNPSRRLWVDQYTWLPLRTETWSSSGGLIRSSECSEIRFNPSLGPDTFSLPARARVTEDPYTRVGPLELSDAASRTGFRPREPRYLPAGYTFAAAHILSGYQSVAIHIRYFDGLSTLSLFEKPSNDVESPQWGGSVSQALSWADGKLAFTLIGDIASTDLQRIQQSLR